MVAVFVHEVVGAAPELLAQLLHYPVHVVLREVGHAQHYRLPASYQVIMYFEAKKLK